MSTAIITDTHHVTEDLPQSVRAAGPPFATVNPFTGETEAQFAFLTAAEADTAIENAQHAFLAWRALPVQERAALLARAADLMSDRAAELAALATREMGKRIADSEFEIQIAVEILRWYAENGPRLLEPTQIHDSMGEDAIVQYEPLGVLLAIEPWNFPFYQAIRPTAPNLLLGNTILLKHSPINPQTALAIEQVFTDAGLPAGVYTNIFLAVDDVERVIAHPSVQGVTLTGSEKAGASVAEIAGRHLKKSVLELGGSDPFIVLDAANLEHTVQQAVQARLLLSAGQTCMAAKRFIVLDEVYDEFVAGMRAAFSSLEPGDPTDRATTLAPLSSQQAVDGLLAQIHDAVDKGATLLVGGEQPDIPGAFLEATLLTDVTPDMRAYREELFGPVGVVYRVRDDDEAIRLANDSSYGLGSAVFASDPRRAQAAADRIEAGMVSINTITLSLPELPFGGIKRSGYGRELSDLGLHEFANAKLIRFAAQAAG